MTTQAIGFFGWKRPDIAKRTLDGLSRCSGVQNWPLVVFLDHNCHPETLAAVSRWKASPLLGIYCASERLGCSGNLTRGIQTLFNLCSERFIVLEDDVYPAEDFLRYMEWQLSSCHTAMHPTLSISAYRPIEDRKKEWGVRDGEWMPFYSSEIKLTPGFHCWGWGTWVNFEKHFMNALLPVRGDAYDDSWDVRLNRYAADNGMGCIIPRICRTLNIGTQDATHKDG